MFRENLRESCGFERITLTQRVNNLSELHRQRLAWISSAALVFILSGCGSGGTPTVNTPTQPPSGSQTSATGNWQFNMTPVQGGTVFPFVSGYVINGQNGVDAAELTGTATTGCFLGRNSIAAGIGVSGTTLSLSSLSINGQYLNFVGTLNESKSSFSGSYKVSGGCADGATGTIQGARYASLSGNYGGTLDATPAQGMQLVLTQSSEGNGNGTFLVAGTATFSGFPCFTTGTLTFPDSDLTGSVVDLSIKTNDPAGAQVIVNGNMDVGATKLNLATVQVIGGACSGTYGTANLLR